MVYRYTTSSAKRGSWQWKYSHILYVHKHHMWKSALWTVNREMVYQCTLPNEYYVQYEQWRENGIYQCNLNVAYYTLCAQTLIIVVYRYTTLSAKRGNWQWKSGRVHFEHWIEKWSTNTLKGTVWSKMKIGEGSYFDLIRLWKIILKAENHFLT